VAASMSAPRGAGYEEQRGANTGWIVGGLFILAVIAVAAFFWFRYHP
jgi:hypothetical protein